MAHRGGAYRDSKTKDDDIDLSLFPRRVQHSVSMDSSSFAGEFSVDEHENIEVASFRDEASVNTNHVQKQPEELSFNEKSKSGKTFRGRLSAFFKKNKKAVAFFVVINLLLCITLGLVARSRMNNANYNRVKPFYTDPDSVDPSVLTHFKEELKLLYAQHSLDTSVLDDNAGDNAPRFAMYWMASDPINNLHAGENEKVKRFALACFYYATNMVASAYAPEPMYWKSAINWLTSKPTCEWEGIDCNGDFEIVGITMSENQLSGALPFELAILAENLRTLDLASNRIYMEGDVLGVFESLVNLEYLLMNDNFLIYDQGLPSQLAVMSNLRKIQLSYNILGGQLEGTFPVLEGMNQLTHLELESNFFNGTFPGVVGDMDSLVYIYMRQNSMRYNMDFLKGGKLTNLFALWLESDGLTGSIPTEIGLLTSLASLSLSDSSLTGTIPQELGNLTDLQRLWLYGNKLEGRLPQSLNNLNFLEVAEFHKNSLFGPMPNGVCEAIASNDYEHKSLTSDCRNSQVQCRFPLCCTECF